MNKRETYKVGLIGAGMVGSQRASVVFEDPKASLVEVSDLKKNKAKEIAKKWGAANCRVTTDWGKVVGSSQVNIVITSTINKHLAPITIAALQNGKHVLCEKPMGRNLEEAKKIAQTAQKNDGLVKMGFNHRFHPAISKAYDLYSSGKIGPIFFIRSVYGHGGRKGYKEEWRADPELSGGGELLDQGIHLIDLSCWFLGRYEEVFGFTPTYFWDLKNFPKGDPPYEQLAGEQLEDNAFIFLRTEKGQVVNLHTSWTQWRNRFNFQIYGRDGSLEIKGLGGSYGTEELILEKRLEKSGAPEQESWEFPGDDTSWESEWKEFTSAINEGRRPLGNVKDGLKAMHLIDVIYDSSQKGSPISIDHESDDFSRR